MGCRTTASAVHVRRDIVVSDALTILYRVFRARVSYNISSAGAKGFTRAKHTAPERSDDIIMEHIISERIIGAVHACTRIRF